MGSTINANNGTLNINILSNPEYGKIKKIKVLKGTVGNKYESTEISILNYNKYNFNYNFYLTANEKCYYRCESFFEDGQGIKNKKTIAYTNPIWLNPK